MEFQLVAEPALTSSSDLLAFVVFGDPARDATYKAVDEALGKALTEVARAESFEGKPQQSLAVWTHGKLPAKRVLVLGGGARGSLTPASLRDLAATAVQVGNRSGMASMTFIVPAVAPSRLPSSVQQLVEGATTGLYKFARYLTGEDAKRPLKLERVSLLTDAKGKKLPAATSRQLKAAIDRGQAIGAAVCHARDMVNEPAGAMTPSELAAQAVAVGHKHKSVTTTVLGRSEIEDLGMGMFLAVARGSDEEPRFVHMVYRPAKKAKKRIALVGKGLTFDSGGYSLKPSASMEDMKVDMSGAAAVIAAMDAIATLGSDHEIHVVAACCENMVSGRAYRLGDVLKSMDGTTVEINNTDAEGRLTLGDALTYVRTKIEPDEVFDFATLTGACVVALGPYTAGVFSDHDRLAGAWMAAAERSGEEMWRMPMLHRLREQLKSGVADMRNTGDRMGGAITAALFLKTFVKDLAWVHVDIAGPASISSGRPSQPKGGTGFAVATIVEYVTGR